MNPCATHVLTIDATDRDPTLVDPDADDTRPEVALHRDNRDPAYLIAHLDEKQHALAFEMRDVVAACVAPC